MSFLPTTPKIKHLLIEKKVCLYDTRYLFQAKDLMYFVIILMVFVVSYAIAAYSVIYPDSKLDLDLVFSVLRLGYWNLYGELLLEDLEGILFLSDSTQVRYELVELSDKATRIIRLGYKNLSVSWS